MEILDKYLMKSNSTAARIIEGEAVVVLPQKSIVNTLNKVGTRIWELADGQNKVSEIIDFLNAEFDVQRETAEKDTIAFVNDLVTKDMLVLGDTPESSTDE